MRGFLNEIKNVAVNRATNRINQWLGSLTSGRGIPRNTGGVFQTNVYNTLSKNPFAGETVIYPEDLGSNDQGHYVQFYINEQENAQVDFQGKSTQCTHQMVLRCVVVYQLHQSNVRQQKDLQVRFVCICLQRYLHNNSQNMVNMKLVVQLQLQLKRYKGFQEQLVSLVQWNDCFENAKGVMGENMKER